MTLPLHEYAALDATAVAALIARGEVSPAEVRATARAAIEQVNPDLNALALPLFDEPLAASPTGPFAGVPFLLKDWGPVAEGVPFTGGTRLFAGAVAHHDSEIMRRFRAAGLVALGSTTTPEMSISFATESRLHGVTRNPWHLDRGVGGSSGGSAALVAAGAVPAAHGNDGAGSVRLPAACCGLVGLKPTRGRTPSGPDVSEGLLGLAYEFALVRTVRDAAAMLDAVSGPEPTGRFALPAPERPYTAAMLDEPGPLRVALATEAWSGVPVDPECAAAAERAAAALESLGHHVERATPAIDADALLQAYVVITAMFIGAAIERVPTEPTPELMEAVSLTCLREGRALSSLDVVAGLHAYDMVLGAAGRFLTGYDLLVTPTMARPAAPHGTLTYDEPAHTVESWMASILAYGPFTAPFNVSGHPAVSLPLAESTDGLPIGVQLVAPAGREDRLLQVARQLEGALPWRDRRPPHGVR